ncbi:hypothetical protein CHS0354_032038 [Potamilus streckersoni]|uniref:Uncharacterized protein n=1 Tax=Potamilus streckersoni TaxID=2493646 RepID=A0AAE0TL71_9BIVA|nr:hypothetical protein CHS0354_032038 [Potamilus streckersoni]
MAVSTGDRLGLENQYEIWAGGNLGKPFRVGENSPTLTDWDKHLRIEGSTRPYQKSKSYVLIPPLLTDGRKLYISLFCQIPNSLLELIQRPRPFLDIRWPDVATFLFNNARKT